MKSFKFILFSLILFLLGCGDTTTTNLICPECKMVIDKNKKENTSYIKQVYFDDIGCMVLWTKAHNSNLDNVMVYAKDAKIYIKATDAHYTINERTPMGYGFTAYQKAQKGAIDFQDMRLRMLRGETMRNPKIRKQILGE